MNSFRLTPVRRSVIMASLALSIAVTVSFTMGAEPSASPRNATNASPIRIAIGSFAAFTEGGEQQEINSVFTDLLTARLGQSARFELIERSAIDAVTREISLSLAQTLKPADAIRVGGLLRADWLLLGTQFKAGTTNTAIIKLVDARTGIIRDLLAVSMNRTDWESSATRVAEFVANSAAHVSPTEQRVFLGIGGFEDLSINNRYPDFRKNLRAALEQAFRGTRYAVVERAMVNPLLAELRLNLSGLTGSALPEPSAQPAFLLVDGTYQSYQDESAKISLVLRVQEIGGGQRLYSLKEPPGQGLEEKIARILKGAMRDLHVDGTKQTRKEEAVTQMNRGLERARIRPDANLREDYFYLGGYPIGNEADKRSKNITEAIEAFEASLLLDPDNAEVKTYLAICLLDPVVDRKEAGRDYLRETISTSTNADIVTIARHQLARSYLLEDDRQAIELLLAVARDQTDPVNHAYLLAEVNEPMLRLRQSGRVSTATCIKFAEQVFNANCRSLNCTNCYLDALISPYNMQLWFVPFERAFQDSWEPAHAYLTQFLPEVAQENPQLTPYIWTSFVLWRGPNNAPVSTNNMERFRASLRYCRDNPGNVPQVIYFYQNYLPPLLEWCVTHGEFESGVILGDILKQIVEEVAVGNSDRALELKHMVISPTFYYYIGYCHRARGNWQAASEAFETAGKKAESVVFEPSGPWGGSRTRIAARDLIEECRQHLSPTTQTNTANLVAQPQPKVPVKFSLGQPVLTLGQPTVFACDGDLVWLTDGYAPFIFDQRDQSLTDLDWPTNVDNDVSCICVDKQTVWWGTRGSGLIEMDKQTRRCRVYTEKDGLLLPHITALALSQGKLWIGFGRRYVGGVGYLDLAARRFIGLSPELDLQTVTNRFIPTLGSETDAPRGAILGLSPAPNGDLAVLTENLGLQHYSPQVRKWRTVQVRTGPNHSRKLLGTQYCVAASSNLVLVGGVSLGSGLTFCGLPDGPFIEPDFRDALISGSSYASGQPFAMPLGVTSLAFDGDRVWVGGRGFLALVDLKTKAIEQLCNFDPNWNTEVQGLQIQRGEIWFAIRNKLYRLTKADIK